MQLKNWKLYGKYPYYEYLFNSVETKTKLNGMFNVINAKVPGSVYDDLLSAGIIEDPYYEMNSLKCEWVAARWWTYVTEFSANSFSKSGSRKFIRFEGIDNKSTIFLNGEKLLEYEGANYPIDLEITDKLLQENSLKVVIESEQMEIGQIGRTSVINSQKPRFGYKWDFSRRLINVGIYGNVFLYETANTKIEEVNIYDKISGKNADLTADIVINAANGGDAELKLKVFDHGRLIGEIDTNIKVKNGLNHFKAELNLSDIELWYPNGCGEQKLYSIEICLLECGKVSNSYGIEYGFKTLTVLKNEGAPNSALPYTFCVNGKKIYIKGFNCVPFDMMYGSEPEKKSVEFLDLIKESGANLLRMWGGGLVGSEEFYSQCGKRGILIWQDFVQSGSGYENIPGKCKKYIEKLLKVSSSIIKSRRNYVSLAVWSGGNELYDAQHVPCTYDDKNITALRRLVKRLDGRHFFYPSTPSGKNSFYNRNDKGNNFDIHGYYKFIMSDGEYHHRLMNESDSLFNSEFSIDSVANLSALEKILSDKNLIVADSLNNLVWRHLGDWWNTLERDREFFGEFKTVEDYVFASQFIQAEGLRYEIETNRRRAFQNSGSIMWQANEPCPNAACTNVIDYYNKPKLAYYAIKNSFAPALVSARYDDFVIDNEDIKLDFFVTNDTEKSVQWKIKITADDENLLYSRDGVSNVANGKSEFIKDYVLTKDIKKGVKIITEANGYINEIIILKKQQNGYCDLAYLKKICTLAK